MQKHNKITMTKGLSVIVRTEQEYKHIQDFLGKDIVYINWQPSMLETTTAIVIWSKEPDYSIGSVGDAEYQKLDGLRVIEFNDYFKVKN